MSDSEQISNEVQDASPVQPTAELMDEQEAETPISAEPNDDALSLDEAVDSNIEDRKNSQVPEETAVNFQETEGVENPETPQFEKSTPEAKEASPEQKIESPASNDANTKFSFISSVENESKSPSPASVGRKGNTPSPILTEAKSKSPSSTSPQSAEVKKKSPPSAENALRSLSQTASPGISPLQGRRLSFGSNPPTVPPTSPIDLLPSPIESNAATDRTESSFWSDGSDISETTVRERKSQDVYEDRDSELPSYWILPPPGSRLAAPVPRPSFFIKRKIQLINERDFKAKKDQEKEMTERVHREKFVRKKEHFEEVLQRFTDLTDDWWIRKEDGLERKTERVKQIEMFQKNKTKELSMKMYENNKKKVQQQQDKLEVEKKERQEAEILNLWLNQASKK